MFWYILDRNDLQKSHYLRLKQRICFTICVTVCIKLIRIQKVKFRKEKLWKRPFYIGIDLTARHVFHSDKRSEILPSVLLWSYLLHIQSASLAYLIKATHVIYDFTRHVWMSLQPLFSINCFVFSFHSYPKKKCSY